MSVTNLGPGRSTQKPKLNRERQKQSMPLPSHFWGLSKIFAFLAFGIIFLLSAHHWYIWSDTVVDLIVNCCHQYLYILSVLGSLSLPRGETQWKLAPNPQTRPLTYLLQKLSAKVFFQYLNWFIKV